MYTFNNDFYREIIFPPVTVYYSTIFRLSNSIFPTKPVILCFLNSSPLTGHFTSLINIRVPSTSRISKTSLLNLQIFKSPGVNFFCLNVLKTLINYIPVKHFNKVRYSHDLFPEANKSPAEGNGAKPPARSGSFVRSGRFSKWDLSSCLTSWTFSCLVLYSWKKYIDKQLPLKNNGGLRHLSEDKTVSVTESERFCLIYSLVYL